MVIAIDKQEPQELVDEVRKLKVEVDYKQLGVGDVLIGDEDVWERKTMSDFVGSLVDGRIWTQLRNMKKNYKYSMLILEGDLPGTLPNQAYILRKRLRMTIASIRYDWKVPVDRTDNIKDTAMFLVAYYSRMGREKRKYYRPVKKQKANPRDIVSDVLCTLPGIGRVKAEELLLTHGTVKGVINLPPEEFRKIKGISMNKAIEIHDILNLSYSAK